MNVSGFVYEEKVKDTFLVENAAQIYLYTILLSTSKLFVKYTLVLLTELVMKIDRK